MPRGVNATVPRTLALAAILLAVETALPASPVPVRYPEGVLHGFLTLKSADGRTLADGELDQLAERGRVTARLTFRFRDGSLQRETTVFTQQGVFRLVSYELVQKGPTFPRDVEFTLDASGHAAAHAREKDGGEKSWDERLAAPDDLANGLVLVLVKNLPPDAAQASVGMIVAAPKPTLVRLRLVNAGEESFTVGAAKHTARRWDAKVEIGGVKGFLARLLKKLPPDTRVLVFPGEAPAFVRSDGPLFLGGPVWRIELSAPVFPDEKRPQR